ncbi:MAG: shikimate dehydrogenase [Dehalococcoidia bacterium]
MRNNIGVMGHPINHSVSPVFQQAALDYLGNKNIFEKWDVPPKQLEEKIKSFRNDSFIASCVTLPHKQNVIPLIDELSDSAKAIGAVNWIYNKQNKLLGDNTDSTGFIRSLSENYKFSIKNKNALVFGAGGAARAIIFGLIESNVKKIIVSNRNFDKAKIISNELSNNKIKIKPIGFDRDSLANYAPYADIIINTTSLGMSGGPAPMVSPISSELISSNTFGYDIVYSPIITPFIKEFEKSDAEYGTGLSMLLYQGVEGIEKALNVKAPVNVMQKALDAL